MTTITRKNGIWTITKDGVPHSAESLAELIANMKSERQ